MGWIKRNLFFVIGGIVALAALGGAGFFIWQGYSQNAAKSTDLNELYGKLKELADSPLQPGDDKTDNTKIAKEQEKQVRDWIAQATKSFQPIAPIPPGQVTSKTFANALNSTIYQLQQEAKEKNVNLPPQYYFSFQVQSSKLTISQSSLEPLAVQLGEVKAITEILFAARINDLEGVQRVRVSEDDAQGLQSDYTDEQPTTNDLAILTPYVVSFRCFTPELARVVSGLATSPNLFIVKWINVQPASGAASPDQNAAATPNPYAGNNPYGQNTYNPYNPYGYSAADRARYGTPPPNFEQPPPGQPPAGRGGLQTVLKEQLLHVTIEVEIVKLLPRT